VGIFDLYFSLYLIIVLLTPWLEIEQDYVKKILVYNFLLDQCLV